MNAKTIVSAVILSFAAIGAAQAANSEPDNVPVQGVYGQADNGASRAQVIAELQQARAAGQTGNGDVDNAPFLAQADSGLTRAQVALGSDFGDTNNQPFQGV
jgi:serine protease inhibitor ecotin